MTHAVIQMLRTHPRPATGEVDALAACIEACFECAETCTACADACLGEERVDALAACIGLNLDCADVCEVTGKLLARLTDRNVDVRRAQLEACRIAARACAAECEAHQDEHEHCRVCAETCRACVRAIDALLGRDPTTQAPSS